MAPTPTIPEMALHMRRLVEGMILDGHLHPVWAEGYEPVRVGSELGWRETPGTDPFDHILRNTSEPICSSDSLHREFLSGRCCEREETRTWQYLFVRKQLSARWNPATEQPEWTPEPSSKLWLTSAEMILELADQAMRRRVVRSRAADPHENGGDDKVFERCFEDLVREARTDVFHRLHTLRRAGTLSGLEVFLLNGRFFDKKTIETLAEFSKSSPPTTARRLARALRRFFV